MAEDPKVTPLDDEANFPKNANYAKAIATANEKFKNKTIQAETLREGKGENGRWTIRQQIFSDDTADDKAKHSFYIANVVGFEKSKTLKVDEKYTHIFFIQRVRAWEEDPKKQGTVKKVIFPKSFEENKAIASANGDSVDRNRANPLIFYGFDNGGAPTDVTKPAILGKPGNAFAFDPIQIVADQNKGEPWRLDFTTAAVGFYEDKSDKKNPKIRVKVISTVSWGAQIKYEGQKLKVMSTAPVVKDAAPQEWTDAVEAWNKAAAANNLVTVVVDK